jgi:hypothetical protein
VAAAAEILVINTVISNCTIQVGKKSGAPCPESVAQVLLGALPAIAATGSVRQVVAVTAAAIQSRLIPDSAEEFPWRATGLGLLFGAMASFAARGLSAGTLSLPSDLAGFLLLVLAVGERGFGIVHGAVSESRELPSARPVAS